MKLPPAALALKRGNIAFNIVDYRLPASGYDAMDICRENGLDPEFVLKTLVCRDDKTGTVGVFVLPSTMNLDLRKAAGALGLKSVKMLPVKELEPLTGYVRGGCSPLGMKKHFPVFIEETTGLMDEIIVNAGCRGQFIAVKTEELRMAAEAEFYDLT